MRSACLVSFDWIACRLMAAHRSRCFIWFLEWLKVCRVSQKSCMPNHIERALAWQGPFLWPLTSHCHVSSPVFTVALRFRLPQPLTNRGWPSIPNAPPRGSSAGGSRSVVAPATAACSISLFSPSQRRVRRCGSRPIAAGAPCALHSGEDAPREHVPDAGCL